MAQFFSAWHFDGTNAIRRQVSVETVGVQFLLVEAERRHGPFDFADLRFQGEKPDGTVYSLDGRDGWRLGLVGPVPAELADMLPAKAQYGGWIDRLGLGRASAAFLTASAAAIAVVLWSPQWLAPLIPASFESKLGDAVVGDFGGRFCQTPDGKAALSKLTAALDKNGGKGLQVEVAKIDMVNAVALPGGKVIIFDGLLKKSSSPDAVAGVLAHEIGHVRERHVMQGLLRQLGLSLVLSGVGGNSGSVLNSLLGLGYTRKAEGEADGFSQAALANANISPGPTADFFGMLARDEGTRVATASKAAAAKRDAERKAADENSAKGNPKGQELASALSGYLASHPVTETRMVDFRNAIKKGHTYRSALSPAEWNAIKIMCTKDTKAKSGLDMEF